MYLKKECHPSSSTFPKRKPQKTPIPFQKFMTFAKAQCESSDIFPISCQIPTAYCFLLVM